MRKTILLFPVIVLMTAFAPAPPDRSQEELKKLQGTWEMVSWQPGGGVPTTNVRDKENGRPHYTMKITGKRLTRTRVGKAVDCEWEITLDARKKPKQLDFRVVKGDANPKSTLGIYRLEEDKLIMEEDKLIISYDPSERPVDFKGTKQVVEIYKRANP
jgi:uncharacterized protein (TIGR03067 family)